MLAYIPYMDPMGYDLSLIIRWINIPTYHKWKLISYSGLIIIYRHETWGCLLQYDPSCGCFWDRPSIRPSLNLAVDEPAVVRRGFQTDMWLNPIMNDTHIYIWIMILVGYIMLYMFIINHWPELMLFGWRLTDELRTAGNLDGHMMAHALQLRTWNPWEIRGKSTQCPVLFRFVSRLGGMFSWLVHRHLMGSSIPIMGYHHRQQGTVG